MNGRIDIHKTTPSIRKAMGESQVNPVGEDEKAAGLVDLTPYLSKTDLAASYRSEVHNWVVWMTGKLEKATRENRDAEEQAEYSVGNQFLRNFLAKRLQWIQDVVTDAELKQSYLLVLPPFSQQGSVKNFLLHFFKFNASSDSEEIVFNSCGKSEKEIRILWDIYQLVRIIDTIKVMEKAVAGSATFPSRFSVEYIKETLGTLENMLNLLIRICVKSEHYADIHDRFPLGVFEAEPILNRTENDNYLINDVALKKFDYRNYFFHIYFKRNMKAKYKGKDLTFKYNYLDFEIMRREFLIHWLASYLKDNSESSKVLDNYVLNSKKLSDLVNQSPETELPRLKQLPANLFNDLIATVNETLVREHKCPIDPLSRNTGEFARQLQIVEKAIEAAPATS